MSERTPQSKPSTRRSYASGGTLLVGTSRMRSSTAMRRPSGRTISRKVGASGVAPCSREAQTEAGKGISALQVPQAQVPCGSGARRRSARLAWRASARVDRSQDWPERAVPDRSGRPASHRPPQRAAGPPPAPGRPAPPHRWWERLPSAGSSCRLARSDWSWLQRRPPPPPPPAARPAPPVPALGSADSPFWPDASRRRDGSGLPRAGAGWCGRPACGWPGLAGSAPPAPSRSALADCRGHCAWSHTAPPASRPDPCARQQSDPALATARPGVHSWPRGWHPAAAGLHPGGRRAGGWERRAVGSWPRPASSGTAGLCRACCGGAWLPPGAPLPPSRAAAHHLPRRVDSLARHFERTFYSAGSIR